MGHCGKVHNTASTGRICSRETLESYNECSNIIGYVPTSAQQVMETAIMLSGVSLRNRIRNEISRQRIKVIDVADGISKVK